MEDRRSELQAQNAPPLLRRWTDVRPGDPSVHSRPAPRPVPNPRRDATVAGEPRDWRERLVRSRALFADPPAEKEFWPRGGERPAPVRRVEPSNAARQEWLEDVARALLSEAATQDSTAAATSESWHAAPESPEQQTDHDEQRQRLAWRVGILALAVGAVTIALPATVGDAVSIVLFTLLPTYLLPTIGGFLLLSVGIAIGLSLGHAAAPVVPPASAHPPAMDVSTSRADGPLRLWLLSARRQSQNGSRRQLGLNG